MQIYSLIRRFWIWAGSREGSDRLLTVAIIVALIIMFIAALTLELHAAEDTEPFTTFKTFLKHNQITAQGRLEGVGYILYAQDKGCDDTCPTTFWLLYKHSSLPYTGLAVRPLTKEQAKDLTLLTIIKNNN
jgi:hypothetical protein